MEVIWVVCSASGQWNRDKSQFVRESLPADIYLTGGCYRIWLSGPLGRPSPSRLWCHYLRQGFLPGLNGLHASRVTSQKPLKPRLKESRRSFITNNGSMPPKRYLSHVARHRTSSCLHDGSVHLQRILSEWEPQLRGQPNSGNG